MEENFKALEKFNFWNGNVPQQGFLRTEYLDKILEFSNNKLISDFKRF